LRSGILPKFDSYEIRKESSDNNGLRARKTQNRSAARSAKFSSVVPQISENYLRNPCWQPERNMKGMHKGLLSLLLRRSLGSLWD